MMSLPPVPTVFGRETEKQMALALLNQHRLVTLTGLAGIGKTTLALAVAHEWSCSPVWFCALASVSKADHIPHALAQALQIQTDEQTAMPKIVEFLQKTPGLLVLDNFEHLTETAPLLSQLLNACPTLKILVTSREVVSLRGETLLDLPPLPIPQEDVYTDLAAFMQVPSVRLFQKQAEQTLAHFQVSYDNAALVAEVCRRVEGIPLAIELAASRLLLFSLGELNERLHDRLKLLTGGPRDVPARQQTLRNTLAWSYELLHQEEKRLFRLLAVFTSSTVAAVEAVCQAAGDMEPPLDRLTSLLQKHLLLRNEMENGQPRFSMFEMVREYALEQLQENQEEEPVRYAHTLYFSTFAKRYQQELDSIQREYSNIRAAFTWLLSHVFQQSELFQEDLSLIYTFLCSLEDFWFVRGLHQEAFDTVTRFLTLLEPHNLEGYAEIYVLASKFALVLGCLEEALSLAEAAIERSEPSATRAQAYLQIGAIESQRHHFLQAERNLSRGISFFRANPPATAKEQEALAQALFLLGDMIADKGEEFDRPFQLLTESMQLFQAQGKHALWGRARHHLSVLYFYHNRLDEAITIGQECLDDVTALGYLMAQGYLSAWQAAFLLVAEEKDVQQIETLLATSLQIFEQVKNPHGTSWTLIHRGRFFLRAGQIAQAKEDFQTSLDIAQRIDDLFLIFHCLDGLAEVSLESSLDEAICFFAETATLRAEVGIKLPPVFRAYQERFYQAFPQMEGSPAWAEGKQRAKQRLRAAGFPIAEQQTDFLTRREQEVLILLAQGLQSKEIAQRLNVSPRTIEAHLRSIYSKLGVNTRSAATRWAIVNRLLD